MISIKIQPRPKENTLAMVAILYPMAFVMAADLTALRNAWSSPSKHLQPSMSGYTP